MCVLIRNYKSAVLDHINIFKYMNLSQKVVGSVWPRFYVEIDYGLVISRDMVLMKHYLPLTDE